MSLSEAEFDRAADDELHALERVLSELDPDEVDVELSSGVLTLTLGDGQKVIVNSHRAARQIWMAAFRNAWHFTPQPGEGGLRWATEKDELRATLARVLAERLGRSVQL
jgi:CyaY protein